MHINCKNPSKNNNNKKLFSCLFCQATNGTTHTEGDCGVRGESKMQRKRLRRGGKKIHFNLLYCSEKYQTLLRRMSFILKITCGRASCLKGLQLTEGSSYLRCLNYSAAGDIYGAGPCMTCHRTPGHTTRSCSFGQAALCARGCRGHPSSLNTTVSHER